MHVRCTRMLSHLSCISASRSNLTFRIKTWLLLVWYVHGRPEYRRAKIHYLAMLGIYYLRFQRYSSAI